MSVSFSAASLIGTIVATVAMAALGAGLLYLLRGNTQPLHCAGHTLGYQTRGELPDRPAAAPHNARTRGEVTR